MYTENPVSGKDPVNQESQALLSQVGGTWSWKLIKFSTCMAMKDNKPALIYELLNLILNLINCNSV